MTKHITEGTGVSHVTSTGLTFTAYEIEYEIELTEEQAAILRKPTRLVHSLTVYLGPALRSLDLKIAESGSWALYIVISARADLHEIREEIGDFITTALEEGKEPA